MTKSKYSNDSTRFFYIVTVRFCLAHSVRCNSRNTLHRHKPVVVIHTTLRSGSGGEGGIEFIRCGDGREPQIHELWTFNEDSINRKVHTFARVDVFDFSGDCFQTYYMTEDRRRVTIFGQFSINASVEWLGVPTPFYDTSGVTWIDNILVPKFF